MSLPNDTFEDLLPLTPVRTAPGEYDVKDRSGRVLWHMEGASLADFVCQSVNGYSTMLRESEKHDTRLTVKDGHIVTPSGKKFRIEEGNNI